MSARTESRGAGRTKHGPDAGLARQHARRAKKLRRKAVKASGSEKQRLERDAMSAFINSVLAKHLPSRAPRVDDNGEPTRLDGPPASLLGGILGGGGTPTLDPSGNPLPFPITPPGDLLGGLTPIDFPVLGGTPLDLFGTAFEDTRRNLLAAANRTGEKWRYEHLKAQAIKAAEDLKAYETQSLQLVQLAAQKVESAQLLLNPILIEVVKELQSNLRDVQALQQDADLDGAIGNLADATSSALLLEELVLWFTTHDVIDFWIGLFGALLQDVCAFDFNVSRTQSYLDSQFSLIDLRAVTDQIKAKLDATVSGAIAPLRAAIEGVIGSTNAALHRALGSIDVPLVGGLAPDDPTAGTHLLGGLEDSLRATVDRLESQLRDKLLKTLEDVLDQATGAFKKFMIVFFVMPILAILGVGIALGAFGAAALAALVLIAAEELISLILRMLTGPIRDQLRDLHKKIDAALKTIANVVGRVTGLVQASRPEDFLDVVGEELRELKELLPNAFLSDVETLLESARDFVMQNAVQLAFAAERALGLENGTAFDAIRGKYADAITPAPQLPGGNDAHRFSASELLRDLGALERQRTQLADGKELELTQRVSLRYLLGTGFDTLLDAASGGSVTLQLTEAGLLDRMFPGTYRALIKEIGVAAQFKQVLPAGVVPMLGFPVRLTHLGESRTRIKKDGNPSSPPLHVPIDRSSFILELFGDREPIVLQRPRGGLGILVGFRPKRGTFTLTTPHGPRTYPYSELEATMLRELGSPTPITLQMSTQTTAIQLYRARHPTLRLDPVANGIGLGKAHVIDAWLEFVPSLMEAAVRRVGLGLVPSDAIIAHIREVLEKQYEAQNAHAGCFSQEVRDLIDQLIGLWPFPLPTPSILLQLRTFTGSEEEIHAQLRRLIDAIVQLDRNAPFISLDSIVRRLREIDARDLELTCPEITQAQLDTLITNVFAAIRGIDLFGENNLDVIPRTVFDEVASDLEVRAAKWGDAQLLVDRDPAITALGYVTLVRRMPAETALFNLLPSPIGLPGQSAAVPATTDDGVRSVAAHQQYRPFENFGIEGALQLELPALDLPIVGTTLTSWAGLVEDLVLEITFRACYDKDLAAAVRASRAMQLHRLQAALPAAIADAAKVVPAVIGQATSELRTIHLSLRAHRDASLAAMLEAVRVFIAKTPGATEASAVTALGLPVTPSTQTFLAANEAFRGFGTALSTLSLAFGGAASQIGEIGKLVVGADQLATAGQLVGLGIATIPTESGVPAYDGTGGLSLALTVAGVAALLPPTTLDATKRLWTSPRAATPLALESLLGTASLTVTDTASQIATGKLYDVIFSVSYRARTTAARVTPQAVV